MKHLMLIAILASFFSVSAFAEGQTTTECPMMKEMNRRVNTKLNLKNTKKPVQSTNTTKGVGA
ncbi:MAG: hypothetical protein H0V66_00550 [Bdellovibrionales bacterium]|nr:hypothetical protein [Bdellovibrionales bacterium]